MSNRDLPLNLLTESLATIDGISVERNSAQTNMAFFSLKEKKPEELAQFLHKENILISPGKTIRLVTHLDITRENILFVVDKIQQFL